LTPTTPLRDPVTRLERTAANKSIEDALRQVKIAAIKLKTRIAKSIRSSTKS
jgi:hypothetical protein